MSMVQRLTRQWNWTRFWMTNRFSTERCRASSQISSCPTSIQSRKSILCDTYLPCRVIYLYSSLFIKHCCINKFVFKILQLSSDELCYMHYSVEFTFFPRCLHYWAFKNTYADFENELSLYKTACDVSFYKYMNSMDTESPLI